MKSVFRGEDKWGMRGPQQGERLNGAGLLLLGGKNWFGIRLVVPPMRAGFPCDD